MSEGAIARPGIVALIAALLLPPLGTFLVRGIGTAFWVTVLLTLVGWLPGVVFALLVMLRPEILPRG
ncbi:YqaE/Pmp3 family membrane protein [Sphingomonas bacterium]|uniref:YqaE/Pmp3 family membrane protein n=1 Tax=Sphingomonas bacterium TaxID=1895847 RepID=UPI00157522F9|nr:YqaE/Pmp3 family membrane protein [Sphingomonas bacterium]